MNGDDWITTQEAAELSGYHPEHLRRSVSYTHLTLPTSDLV